MKFLLIALCITFCIVSSDSSFAQSKKVVTNKLLPPPPDDPGGGGGGGGAAQIITGGIFYQPFTLPQGADVVLQGYEDNGPDFTSNELVINVSFLHSQSVSYNCTYAPQTTNDEARSAIIYGNLSGGRVFVFYDHSGGSSSDDYTTVYFKQPLPTGYKYKINTFENSYEDAYARVIYYPHNGLDGKVSLINSFLAPQ